MKITFTLYIIMAFKAFVSAVQDEIFNRVREEMAGNCSMNDIFETSIPHEEIDEAVSRETLEDVEKCLVDYGIHNAIKNYIDEFGIEAFGHLNGDVKGKYSRALLYVAVMEEVRHNNSPIEYYLWLEDNGY